jgi:hypothetical protein
MPVAQSVTAILAGYFNVNDDFTGVGKRPLKEFTQELRALTADEKMELAVMVCEQTGQKIKS